MEVVQEAGLPHHNKQIFNQILVPLPLLLYLWAWSMLDQFSASELPSLTPAPSGYSTLLSHLLTTQLPLTQFAPLDLCVSEGVNLFIEKALGLRTSSHALKLQLCLPLRGGVELAPCPGFCLCIHSWCAYPLWPCFGGFPIFIVDVLVSLY